MCVVGAGFFEVRCARRRFLPRCDDNANETQQATTDRASDDEGQRVAVPFELLVYHIQTFTIQLSIAARSSFPG